MGDFPDISVTSVSQLKGILHGNALGKKVLHVSYENSQLVTYNGKLKKSRRSNIYKVAYWALHGTYDDATDYDMSIYVLAADLLHGDLIVCEEKTFIVLSTIKSSFSLMLLLFCVLEFFTCSILPNIRRLSCSFLKWALAFICSGFHCGLQLCARLR